MNRPTDTSPVPHEPDTIAKSRIRWRPLLVIVALLGAGAALFPWVQQSLNATGSAPAPADDGRIHVPLFLDPAKVRPTPRFRFTFDRPQDLADLRKQEKLDDVVAGAHDELERCIRLMRWTRRQWEPGVPNPYPPLDARIILRDIRSGFTKGFCAQYNYVLVQGLQSLGIYARYVTLMGHEVIEARPRELNRWVCLDPLYDTLYTDDAGRLLSVYEVHRRLIQGRPVRITNDRLMGEVEQKLKAFSSFAVWLKNDHVGSPLNFADLERYKVHYLDSPDAGRLTPLGSLTTLEPADLYPDDTPSPAAD